MEERSRPVQLFHYLQDPHLVARFQSACGVRGVSRTGGVSLATSSGEADRTHPADKRDYRRHDGSGNLASGDEEAKRFRNRFGDSNFIGNTGDGSGGPPQNGSVVPAGGDGVGPLHNGGRLAGSSPACRSVQGGKEGEEGSRPAGSSTLKPLRRNSLTGDGGQEFLIDNRFLFYLFTFGTELGNELFYTVFFPFIMWNMDAFVSRRLIMVWVWVMYLGQCTKDVIGWSRPASPPVVKVEMFYNSEYSMPSTHAMSATAIPFSLFFMTYGRWEDVIAGVLYSAMILLFFLPALDLIDDFNLSCRYSPFIIVFFHLGLGLFSFTLDTWSTSRGDTAQILGTGAGVALASHVNRLLGLMPDPAPEQLPLALPALSAALVGVCALRLLLGVLVLLATRALMKAITIPAVCRVFGVPSADVRKARQHMEVELPYRYIVYGTMGFNVLFLVPLLFRHLRLL
ncbi:sphingosine-1-phosphate phosphatase 1 isoform X2 [Antennarius striatus]|uniref:sphingosine-1-phosphate phosphatase 1 isoform X2 n=1 Tax=Antennarius striatus TaxID=241820 RepID=UPI0035B4AC07